MVVVYMCIYMMSTLSLHVYLYIVHIYDVSACVHEPRCLLQSCLYKIVVVIVIDCMYL